MDGGAIRNKEANDFLGLSRPAAETKARRLLSLITRLDRQVLRAGNFTAGRKTMRYNWKRKKGRKKGDYGENDRCS